MFNITLEENRRHQSSSCCLFSTMLLPYSTAVVDLYYCNVGVCIIVNDPTTKLDLLPFWGHMSNSPYTATSVYLCYAREVLFLYCWRRVFLLHLNLPTVLPASLDCNLRLLFFSFCLNPRTYRRACFRYVLWLRGRFHTRRGEVRY